MQIAARIIDSSDDGTDGADSTAGGETRVEHKRERAVTPSIGAFDKETSRLSVYFTARSDDRVFKRSILWGADNYTSWHGRCIPTKTRT